MTVRTDGRHAAWMRALIDGRQADGQRLGEELTQAGAAGPLVPFLHYAFSLAIRQASGGTYTRTWVVRVVADLRAGLDGTPAVIDPVAAESEIFRALGEHSVPVFPDGDARAAAQAALLRYAAYGMGLDEAGVTNLLAEARAMADRDLDQERRAMTVTPDHVAAVRALVTGDDDTFGQLAGSTGPEWLDVLARLLAAVFTGAVKHRFAGEASRPDIIRFVARSRIRHGGDSAGFGPGTAEAMIGAAAGISPVPASRSEAEEAENAAAQVALLKDLAGEVSFLDFESLLATARAELNKLGAPANNTVTETR